MNTVHTPTKPMLVLIFGLPGVGKSTAARFLENELPAVHISSDVTRRELFPDIRTFSSQETGRVIREVEHRVRKRLEQGESVVIDALFTKQKARNEYKQLAEQVGVQYRVIHITAPEERIRTWMEERQKQGDASEANFSYYLDRKPYLESDPDAIMVENNGTVNELHEKIEQFVEAYARD